ncbi:MAG: glycoside hydrolase family 95 protein [Tannerella sp.]|jgi:alpha-L-fucosidase 2|nr:glycoside hydrolase family 95 protein [Tannerella sp.]
MICLFFRTGIYAAAIEPAEDVTVRFEKPASEWLGAFPLGNGRIGAMVFGGVAEERIILNESSLYSREFSIYDTLPDMTRHIDMLARMIKNGDYADADEYATRHVTGPAVPCYQPLGDILVQFSGQDEYSDYVRELDLSNAVAKVAYHSHGTDYTREVFVSHPDNILIIRFKSSRKKQLNFNMRVNSPHPNTTQISRDKELIFDGRLPAIALRRTLKWVEEWEQQWKYPEIWDGEGKRKADSTIHIAGGCPVVYNEKGMKFGARIRVLRCDGRVWGDEDKLWVKDAQDVTIAVAIASSFNGFDKDPVTEGADVASLNRTTISSVKNKSYGQLLNAHVRDFRNLFNRVSLQIPDLQGKRNLTTEQRKTGYSLSSDPSFAALQFQFGRYLLISSSRPGGQPANLQGLWNVDIIPPWASAYTVNINMQMNYWAAESANLSECHEPLFRFLEDVSVTGSRVARSMYGLPGWVLHHNSSLWRGAHPVDWYGFISFWPMGGGWLCQHLWKHYLYANDIQFLRETAYPLMKGAALFYNSWLTDDGNGYSVTPVSNSPENQFIYIDGYGRRKSAGMAMACALDMAIIRELFQNTIEAQRILRTDSDFSVALTEKLAKLYPYQIGERGQFLEYYREFIESPPRHNTSPYYPLYPGDQFTLEKNPELTQALKTLILNRTESRRGGGGWVGAWYAALFARLGEGERTIPYIEGLLRGTHLNMLGGNGNVFQIDANLGYTAAVAEMLLQSHSGVIKLLPALPGVWPSGTVRGLCAEGNFEISMTWEDGKLISADIKSNTANRAGIKYGGRTVELQMKPGEIVRLNAELEIIK